MVRMLGFAALICALPLSAADFSPSRFDDPAPNGCLPGDCSLREALIAANAAPGRDRILLAAGTYALSRLKGSSNVNDETQGPLWIRENVDFVGQGQGFGGTTVRWTASLTANTQVFFGWDEGAPLDVSWSRMRVSHGNDPYGNGCFYLPASYSRWRLDNVIVRDCRGSFGGAIGVNQSTLTLIASTIEYNQATNDGGGIGLSFASTLITSGARIRSNTAGRDGGGVSFSQYQLTSANTAFWSDDGTSSVTSNVAGRDGGGLSVGGDVTLELDGSEPDSLARLSFGKNRAAGVGGAIARRARFVSQQPQRLHLRQVSLGYNAAPWGGGIDAREPITVEAVEFRGNTSSDGVTAGSGAGLHLDVDSAPSTITRSSFWLNDSAALAGGGIYSNGCASLALQDVSLHDNRGARAAAIGVHGPLELRHVTVSGNSGTYAELYQYSVPDGCGAQSTIVANSLIADRCSARWLSAGGNQFGPDATACSATRSDQRQASDAVFGLVAGTHGGAFMVLGWPSDGQVRPQRDFGLDASCSASDVRGLPRPAGACDAGAFEQQP